MLVAVNNSYCYQFKCCTYWDWNLETAHLDFQIVWVLSEICFKYVLNLLAYQAIKLFAYADIWQNWQS